MTTWHCTVELNRSKLRGTAEEVSTRSELRTLPVVEGTTILAGFRSTDPGKVVVPLVESTSKPNLWDRIRYEVLQL